MPCARSNARVGRMGDGEDLARIRRVASRDAWDPLREMARSPHVPMTRCPANCLHPRRGEAIRLTKKSDRSKTKLIIARGESLPEGRAARFVDDESPPDLVDLLERGLPAVR